MIIEKYVDGKPISAVLRIISGEKLKNFKNAQFSRVQKLIGLEAIRLGGWKAIKLGGYQAWKLSSLDAENHVLSSAFKPSGFPAFELPGFLASQLQAYDL